MRDTKNTLIYESMICKYYNIKKTPLSYRDPPILKAHNNTDIILRLPMGQRIKDIRWLSVWCRRFTVSSKINTEGHYILGKKATNLVRSSVTCS